MKKLVIAIVAGLVTILAPYGSLIMIGVDKEIAQYSIHMMVIGLTVSICLYEVCRISFYKLKKTKIKKVLNL